MATEMKVDCGPIREEPTKPQRILVMSFTKWEHHLATDLELIQKHLYRGDHVTVLACVEDVQSCRVNINHEPGRCRECVNARFEGLALLDTSAGDLDIVRMGDVLTQAGTPVTIGATFDSLDSARELVVDDWDLGLAACSTAISAFRDHELASVESQNAWTSLVEAGNRSFRAAQELMQRDNYDRVYVFNGRDVMARGVFRAAQQAGVEVCVHERGRGNDRYALFVGTLPHDRDGFHSAMLAAWDQADPVEREKVGASFYERSRAGVDQRWTTFVADQEPGSLPPGWDPAQRNVVIFNSSEDEYAAIGPDWKNPLYESQADGARAIVESLLADPTATDLRLWVRMHPNLTGVDNGSTRAYLKLADLGVGIIEATSTISSYSLVDAADVVVSFGSTVGIEATYWGTPSILLGPSFFSHLNGTHRPATHEAAVELIRTVSSVADRVDALKYGNYLLTQGEPYEHYRATGFHDGAFNGHNIRQGRTPLRLVAPQLARMRLERPAAYEILHPAARLLLHRPIAPLHRSWRNFADWSAEQPLLRRAWHAAKARGLVSPGGV